MHIEVEVKAKVLDVPLLKKRLQTLGAQFQRDYCKIDLYYRCILPDATKQDVRLRTDNGVFWVTFKDKSMSAGVEINKEHEFTVSDENPFLELLKRFGANLIIRKVKKGTSWMLENLHVEISDVEGLGDFVEIEYVNDVPDAEVDKHSIAAKALVEAARKKLEIPDSDVEKTPYTVLLLARQQTLALK